jgi:FAD/FMN-containing dehydrogenase
VRAPTPGFVHVGHGPLRELEALLGPGRVITKEVELESLSKDCYWYSPVLMDRLVGRQASAVAKVRSLDELRGTLAIAYRNDLPVTTRGGATGNYGQAIPLCGGLVVDITGFSRILSIEDGVARCEPGVRMQALEREARALGWELRCLPSTWARSTVSGFVAGGSGGIGSITWGGLREPGTIKRLRLLTLDGSPREVVLEEAETLKAFHAFGTNGVISEVELRLAPARRWDQVAVTSPDWARAAAFARWAAWEDAVPKRLASLLEPSFAETFAPLRKWLPPGHSVVFLEVDESSTQAVVAEAQARGLVVPLVIPHQEPKCQPMLMEFAWNHSTLWMLNNRPNHTYLQLGLGPDFEAQTAQLKERFPGKVHLHVEFIRGRSTAGEFGKIVPVLLPVVEFVSERHLIELIEFAEEIGISSDNPHTCYLGERGTTNLLEAQVRLKREVDPKGLLNPGKLLPAGVPPALAAALPTFLYQRAVR